jgi:HK97 family phage prohead protease
MEKRSFEIREADYDKREVVGRAVPYNEVIDIGGGYQEEFTSGAVDLTADVKLFRDHKEVIGKVQELEDRKDGLWVRAKISKTQLGDETLELVKDGGIRSFSVGFIPVVDEKQDRKIIRKKVDLKEVSLVAFPAYENASVVEVREEVNQEEKSMDNTNTDASTQIAEVRSFAEELERKIEVLSTAKVETPASPQYRSFGEFAKAVAAGDEKAIKLHRDFTGGKLADSIVNNAWVKTTIDILDKGRPTFAAFNTQALPAEGMNVEYVVLDTDTTAVDEQEAEGDTLAFGKITLDSATAPVKTIGGYTSMSRQVMDRSSVAYVDAVFRALAIKYASKTNNMVKAVLAANAANLNTGSVAANNFEGWVEAIATASSDSFNETGLVPDFMLVSSDAFIEIAKIKNGDAPLLAGNNIPANIGSLNPVGLTGQLYGLPLVVDPSLAAGTVYVANRSALVNYESAGAPFRLSQDEITNLTSDFSVWGYLASTLPTPKAITKLTLA